MAAPMTPLIYVEQETVSKLTPGVAQTTADLHLRVLRAGVDTVELTVPADHDVVDVKTESLKEWKLFSQGNSQRVWIKLNEVSQGDVPIQVQMEQAVTALPMTYAVPVIHVLNAARETGTTEIHADAAFLTTVEAGNGLML